MLVVIQNPTTESPALTRGLGERPPEVPSGPSYSMILLWDCVRWTDPGPPCRERRGFTVGSWAWKESTAAWQEHDYLLGADQPNSPPAASTSRLANLKLSLSEGQDRQPCCPKLFPWKERHLHKIVWSDIPKLEGNVRDTYLLFS